MDRTQQSAPKHPLHSGMDHALDGEAQGPVKQLRRPGDNGPAMQSVANNSPQVKQLTASEAAANTAVVQRKASNETGLPKALQAGMESLSGFSLDHVRVEYNSSKPAEVNALAYAEGSKIYVAPGQEQHLPEELGHVVQQMRGDVKATTQVNGKAINNNETLENEAQSLGQDALAKAEEGGQQPAGALRTVSVAETGAPIQRKVKRHDTTHIDADYYAKKAHDAASEIDDIVDQAYDTALLWSSLDPGSDKHLQNWCSSALNYAQNPAEIPKMIYARFGYAVETIASKKIEEKGTFQGFDASLQESSGHTRPDVVLREGEDVVAWLDITAEGSKGHIHKKQSSLWRKQPYIAELIYPSLDLNKLLEDTKDPMIKRLSGYLNEKRAIDEDHQDDQKAELEEGLLSFKDEQEYDMGGDQGIKKEETAIFLSEKMGMKLYSPWKASAHGALKFVGVPAREFGFYGQDSCRILAVRDYIAQRAQPGIDVDYAIENLSQFRDIANELAGYKDYKAAWDYAIETQKLNEQVKTCLQVIRESKNKVQVSKARIELGKLVVVQSDQIEKGFSVLHSLECYKMIEAAKKYIKENHAFLSHPKEIFDILNGWLMVEIQASDNSNVWRKHYFEIKKRAAKVENMNLTTYNALVDEYVEESDEEEDTNSEYSGDEMNEVDSIEEENENTCSQNLTDDLIDED